MDEFSIDSHKLQFHVEKVSRWLKGELTFPIYIEVSPSGACNHRCAYCALDFMGYEPRLLDADAFKERLKELGRLGVKSVMYAGEGEPLVHKDIDSIIRRTNESGIDAALTTNGALMDKGFVESALKHLTWVKISLDAGAPATHATLHGADKGDFSRIIKNIEYAVMYRKKRSIKTTIGVQMILLPENAGEAEGLARLAKKIGVDYLVIKSYSQHPKSITRKYQRLDYNELTRRLGTALQGISGDGFSVVLRTNAIKRLSDKKRDYKKCLSLPFWAYIDSGANVWACSAYLRDKRFLCGNLRENTFRKIWTGEKRKNILRYVDRHLAVEDCRRNCRMEEANKYLWELKNPSRHINFI
ncbi:MAG: radical SAM protein [Deltaproteobacteria bacterium]